MVERHSVMLVCLDEVERRSVRAALAVDARVSGLAVPEPPAYDLLDAASLKRAFVLARPDVLVYVSEGAVLGVEPERPEEPVRDLRAGLAACAMALERGVRGIVLVVAADDGGLGSLAPGRVLVEHVRRTAERRGAHLGVVEVDARAKASLDVFVDALGASLPGSEAPFSSTRVGSPDADPEALPSTGVPGPPDLLPPAFEEITDGSGAVLAMVLRGSFAAPGIRFFSDPGSPQQIGFINYPVGHAIPAHVHVPVERVVTRTQETLFVRSGLVRLDVYGEDRRHVRSVLLTGGDVVHLIAGGHGLEIVEPTTMVEVKQGPYLGDGEKARFEAVSDDPGQ